MSVICIESCRLFHPPDLAGDYSRHSIYERDLLSELYPDLFWKRVDVNEMARKHKSVKIPKENDIYMQLKKIERDLFLNPDSRPEKLINTVFSSWIAYGNNKDLNACDIRWVHYDCNVQFFRYVKASKEIRQTIIGRKPRGWGIWQPCHYSCEHCILSIPYYGFLYYLSKNFKPKNMLEIGTFLGAGALHLLAGNPEANIVCVDIEFPRRDLLESNPNITLIQGDSRSVVDQVAQHAPFGVVFIDSHHSYEQTSKELALYKPLFAEGAIALFDDIWINDGMRRFWDELEYPKMAMPALNKFGFGVKVY